MKYIKNLSLKWKTGIVLGIVLIIFLFTSKDFREGFREGVRGSNQEFPCRNNLPSESVKMSGSKSSGKNNSFKLESYNGSHYSARIPKGWHVAETSNGIDISHPQFQGVFGVSHAILVGAFGQASAHGFSEWIIQSMGGFIIKIVRNDSLPSINDPFRNVWTRNVSEYVVNIRGQNLHMMTETSVANSFGQFCAMCLMLMCPEDIWPKEGPLLAEIGKSIVIVNASQMGSERMLAKNNPLDNSAIIGAGETRQASQDYLSREWQEAIMGFENTTSNETGEHFQIPYQYYDPTVHGYHNPRNPEEIMYPDE
jgi:hypothetical protein